MGCPSAYNPIRIVKGQGKHVTTSAAISKIVVDKCCRNQEERMDTVPTKWKSPWVDFGHPG
jgi:hypothetical protein